MATTWRLLVTEPLDGVTNMAIDEALLRARIAGEAPPTVRFYGWRPATVSLGYAQPLGVGVDWASCARSGIGRVRRPTGGSAILHEPPEREVTYGVVARASDFAGADDVLETYRVLAAGLLAGLGRLGLAACVMPPARGRGAGRVPTFCFRRTGAYEIAVGDRKLVGSAQRRQAGAFLQHGSVLLAADPARLRAVFPGEPDPMAELTTVALALGRPVGFDTMVSALTAGMEATLGVALAPDGLSPGEAALVERLVEEKYATAAWTEHGEVSATMAAASGPTPPSR